MDSITEDDSQLFDKIFKLMLFLSNRAVISFINGLFRTNHPLDSVVAYPNTEFVSTHFKRIQSDLLITINGTRHRNLSKTTLVTVLLQFSFLLLHKEVQFNTLQ
ncbi:hypothetical protein FACS1894200_01830 [Spirochaetia bacterium]|nr:hypothetical protein FACS1894200_01830 [Spirochaetia bacterium]